MSMRAAWRVELDHAEQRAATPEQIKHDAVAAALGRRISQYKNNPQMRAIYVNALAAHESTRPISHTGETAQ